MGKRQTAVNTNCFNIICFTSAYWDEPLWTNKQHVMSRISQNHRVLYVEPGLSILGCIRGWKRLQHPWRRLFPWISKKHPRLYLLYLPVLPGSNIQVIEKINRLWMGRILALSMRLLRFHNPILWFYRPQDVHILEKLHAAFVCYDCVDNFSEFPIFAKVKQQILHAEQKLVNTADMVFTSSSYLYNTHKKANPHTYYVPNVADIEHFKKTRLPETPIPDDIITMASPVIGFVGAINSHTIDFPLLCLLAERHPDWQIVLIGPIGQGELAPDLRPVQSYSNIHFLGYRPPQTLPGYIKKFDVCIIPYQINRFMQGVFPMKFYEYMATGKPIVTTALPSLLAFANIVSIAHSPHEFVEAIEALLQHDPTKDQRLQEVEGRTWEARTDQIMSLITKRLKVKCET